MQEGLYAHISACYADSVCLETNSGSGHGSLDWLVQITQGQPAYPCSIVWDWEGLSSIFCLVGAAEASEQHSVSLGAGGGEG